MSLAMFDAPGMFLSIMSNFWSNKSILTSNPPTLDSKFLNLPSNVYSNLLTLTSNCPMPHFLSSISISALDLSKHQESTIVEHSWTLATKSLRMPDLDDNQHEAHENLETIITGLNL